MLAIIQKEQWDYTVHTYSDRYKQQLSVGKWDYKNSVRTALDATHGELSACPRCCILTQKDDMTYTVVYNVDQLLSGSRVSPAH